MLSILIPTYNYNIYPLVSKIYDQALKSGIVFEINVYDDFSTKYFFENEKINKLKWATFTKLKKNIGRSSIRNLLAKNATYNILLFLDADTMVIQNNFIQNYLNALNDTSQIIYGGICYQKDPPPSDEILRWVYGKKREALVVSERIKKPHLSFLTLNFLIKKEVFQKVEFNEKIPNLRHEDTLFALDSKKNRIKVLHIDNPVMHLGLEKSEVFLRKSNEAVDAIILFIKKGLINENEIKLTKKAEKIIQLRLDGLVIFVYKLFHNKMKKNLLSKKPSLFIFDLYRLGYYLQNKTFQNV